MLKLYSIRSAFRIKFKDSSNKSFNNSLLRHNYSNNNISTLYSIQIINLPILSRIKFKRQIKYHQYRMKMIIRRRKGCKSIINCEHLDEKHYAKVNSIIQLNRGCVIYAITRKEGQSQHSNVSTQMTLIILRVRKKRRLARKLGKLEIMKRPKKLSIMSKPQNIMIPTLKPFSEIAFQQ
ncbi:UNKNOWN [Stylonychia lemnae]|uniref:Uncharacterized protein n=1 Tax=Stylonychia lemnae TaxID=5949 RepID=A0A078AQ88_STYLE|nr:UNKNOWN [Stylonychia lemnae]|eukprot:CDW84329.1 UNKNOWN [Stylonychia lemnae]